MSDDANVWTELLQLTLCSGDAHADTSRSHITPEMACVYCAQPLLSGEELVVFASPSKTHVVHEHCHCACVQDAKLSLARLIVDEKNDGNLDTEPDVRTLVPFVDRNVSLERCHLIGDDDKLALPGMCHPEVLTFTSDAVTVKDLNKVRGFWNHVCQYVCSATIELSSAQDVSAVLAALRRVDFPSEFDCCWALPVYDHGCHAIHVVCTGNRGSQKATGSVLESAIAAITRLRKSQHCQESHLAVTITTVLSAITHASITVPVVQYVSDVSVPSDDRRVIWMNAQHNPWVIVRDSDDKLCPVKFDDVSRILPVYGSRASREKTVGVMCLKPSK